MTAKLNRILDALSCINQMLDWDVSNELRYMLDLEYEATFNLIENIGR